jgi:hypothetical protein
MICDRSTNATYVVIGQDPELRVHRDELHLRKSGTISMGSRGDQHHDIIYSTPDNGGPGTQEKKAGAPAFSFARAPRLALIDAVPTGARARRAPGAAGACRPALQGCSRTRRAAALAAGVVGALPATNWVAPSSLITRRKRRVPVQREQAS